MDNIPLPPMNPEVARLRRQSAQRKLRKRLRHVRLLWTIAGVLLIAFLVEVLIALSFSPRFWVYRITVNDADTLSSAQVIRLMHLPIQSNYYRVSLGKLAARVRAEQRVASVRVKRGRIGALVVDVRERQAVCQIGYSTPPLYLDAHGYLFTRPLPPTTSVPIVEGISVRSPKRALGKPLRSEQARLVLECLREIQKPPRNEKVGSNVELDIARVVISPKKTINLVLRQGTEVLIGPVDDLAEKAWCIRQTIAQASMKGYTLERLYRIDVTYIDEETGVGATFRPKKDQEETSEP